MKNGTGKGFGPGRPRPGRIGFKVPPAGETARAKAGAETAEKEKKFYSFEGVLVDYLAEHPVVARQPIRLLQMIAAFNRIIQSNKKITQSELAASIREKKLNVPYEDVYAFAGKILWASTLVGGSVKERKLFLKLMGEKIARQIREGNIVGVVEKDRRR